MTGDQSQPRAQSIPQKVGWSDWVVLSQGEEPDFYILHGALLGVGCPGKEHDLGQGRYFFVEGNPQSVTF